MCVPATFDELSHLQDRGPDGWELDDGGEPGGSLWNYSLRTNYESSELSFSGDYKITLLSRWVSYGKGVWREQAIHQETGVQVGYKYSQEGPALRSQTWEL